MDREVVERADPHIGLRRRGTGNPLESRTFVRSLPCFDRPDHVAPMKQEKARYLVIEKPGGA